MTDDDTDPDEIPLDILRVAQEVSQAWRHCRRKSCKRGRACRGRNVQCASERVVPKPRNPEKAARDQVRSMAVLQRMLKEKLEEHSLQGKAAVPQGQRRGRSRVN